MSDFNNYGSDGQDSGRKNDGYRNPHKVNPLKNRAFARYLGLSLVAIFVILIFVLFIWLAGGRQRGIPDDIDFIQLKTPADDAPVAVFETNVGTFKAVLFPDETPEYYRYFKSLCDAGYYDGTHICAVVDKAYALGGTKSADPEEPAGADSDISRLKAEVSDNLWPIKGAMCSYIGGSFGKNYAGSSFILINDVTVVNEAYMDEDALKRGYGDELGSLFAEQGGIPNFSMKYTIFAQVYDGWDAFDKIMSAEALETTQPAEDIVFEKVYLTTYKEAQ